MKRFDPTPLQHFIANIDRDKPILFAGRATEIAAVDDAIKAVERGSVAGQTLLFTRSPGAGKTALLRHLQLHLTDCRSASFPAHALSDPRQVIDDAIETVYRRFPKTAKKLPQDAAYMTLLNRGLLQECRARHFDAPIPSMRDFIDREARKEGWQPA